MWFAVCTRTSSSTNIKCHLVGFLLVCVCGQSIWSPGVQVPRVLLAATSGSGGAYIICYEAWMSSSNYGKTQGPIYSPCSHGYHNINTLKAIKVSLNNLQFLKRSLSLSLGG